MSKVVFSGCSFTAGSGWDKNDPTLNCKDDPNLWTNLCCSQIDQLQNLEVLNVSNGGASNLDIFLAALKTIVVHKSDIDTLFCQWTSMPRYNFSVGFELWNTSEGIGLHKKHEHDVNLNRGETWNRKYLNDLLDRLLVLHHLHGEIVKLVEYSNILKKITQQFNIKLYFINGLCPWDQDYFTRLINVLPEQFTEFTKKEILNIDSRDDNDIFKLYKIMHDDYDQAGGIDAACWINLYNSMNNNKPDTNYDNRHPGINSNQLYFQQIKNFLETH
jgi:hypothetical protein